MPFNPLDLPGPNAGVAEPGSVFADPADPFGFPDDVFAPYTPPSRSRPSPWLFAVLAAGVVTGAVALFVLLRGPLAARSEEAPRASVSITSSPSIEALSTTEPAVSAARGTSLLEPALPEDERSDAAPGSLAAHYTYDLNGNLQTRRDANGAVTTYEYDALNRLTAIHYPDRSSVTYVYDTAGRRIGMTDSLGTTAYEYDIHDRLVSITDPNGHTLQYEYDPRGLLTRLTYPDGVATSYTWDEDGRLSTVQDPVGVTRYQYDKGGRLIGRSLPNGVTSRHEYDPANRLAVIEHRDPDGGLLLGFRYEYNAVNNRTQMTRTEAGAAPQVTRYEYDALDRLVRVSYPDGEVGSYQYDAAGNRTLLQSSTHGETRYTYNTADQLIEVAGPDSRMTYRYDANGNLVERRDEAGNVVQYIWDHENRLIRVIMGASTIEYKYDGDGRRLAKIVDGQKTEYVQHGLLLPQVLEVLTGNDTTRTFLGRQHSGESRRAGVRFYLEDALGSVVGVTDAGGRLEFATEYSAAGEVRGDVLPVAFGYTGEQSDLEVGLVYLRERYYDPTLGRFYTPDPYPPLVSDPRTLGRYVYALGNPVNLTDPQGLSSQRSRMGDDGPSCADYSACNFYVQARIEYRFGVTVPGTANAMYAALQQAAASRNPITAADGRSFNVTAFAYDPQNKSHIPQVEQALRSGSLVLPTWSSEGTGIGHGHIAEVSKVASVSAARGTEVFVNQAALGGTSSTDLRLTQAFGSSKLSSTIGNFQFYVLSEASQTPPTGGVSLGQIASVLGDLNDISGATVDPNTGQLILIGRSDAALPPMNPDDLAVAIRAVYSGEDPGVTMVPVDPTMRDITQRVEYFGHTENTHFGRVMFEADRYLKSLAGGQDTLTGQPLAPDIPGFASEIDLMVELKAGDVPWHRNWFLPGEVVLQRSVDGQSMLFDRATMRLESRFIQFDAAGNPYDVPGSSPVTDRFTRSVTEQYDELAATKPELAELVGLAKIVGVVKWLRDNDIPVDLTWMQHYPLTPVDTPMETPGLVAQRTGGGGAYTITSMGGVSYDTPNTYAQDTDGRAAALGATALESRPESMPITWRFSYGGAKLTALAVNLAPTEIIGGHLVERVDVSLQAAGGQTISFIRRANSLTTLPGPMGRGWIPVEYSLVFRRVPVPDDPQSFYTKAVLTDRAGQTEYNLANDNLFYPSDPNSPYQVMGLTGEEVFEPLAAAGVTLSPALPGEPLKVQDTNGRAVQYTGVAAVRKDGTRLAFSPTGRLAAIRDAAGNSVNYVYEDSRLVAVKDDEGRGIDLTYDLMGKLTGLLASDNRAVRYAYDAAGDLVRVSDETGASLESYAYDAGGRLSRIMDSAGRIVLQNSYDNLGRVITHESTEGGSVRVDYDSAANTATYTGEAGHTATRRYNRRKRLVAETDAAGATTTYEYDSQDHLTAVTDPNGNTTRFTYDSYGLLTDVDLPLGGRIRWRNYNEFGVPELSVDPLGRMVLRTVDAHGRLISEKSGLQAGSESADGGFSYFEVDPASVEYERDRAGRVSTVKDPAGFITRFSYDERGNLTAVRLPGGGEIRQAFDARSRLISVTDASGFKTGFAYDPQSRLIGVSTAAGEARYGYTNGDLTSFTDALNRTHRYEYSASGQLARVFDPGGGVTSLDYDSAGRLLAVRDAKGRSIAYSYDAEGRLTHEAMASDAPMIGPAAEHPSALVDEVAGLISSQSAEVPEIRQQLAGLTAVELESLRVLSSSGRLYGQMLDPATLAFLQGTGAQMLPGSEPLALRLYGAGERKLGVYLETALGTPGRAEALEKVRRHYWLQSEMPGQVVISLVTSGQTLKVLAGNRFVEVTPRELETFGDRLARLLAFLPPLRTRAALSAGDLAQLHPGRLGQLLMKNELVPAGAGIIGFDGDLAGLNFQRAFPKAQVYRTQGTNVEEILRRRKHLETLQVGLNDITVLNGIPDSEEEVKNAKLNIADTATWRAAHAKWHSAVKQRAARTAPASADALLAALQFDRLVVVLVAHSNGVTIYLPDGSKFEVASLSPEVRQKIADNEPVVWLFSCRTGSIQDGQSLVQGLLDAGATSVIAPVSDVEPEASAVVLERFLDGISQGQAFLEALKEALGDARGVWYQNHLGRAPAHGSLKPIALQPSFRNLELEEQGGG